jgi:hypothetical protein
LLELRRATGPLFTELLLLARQTLLALSSLSRPALWSTLTLLDLWRATGTLLAELLLLTRQTLLALSRLPGPALWSLTATLLELLRLAGRTLLALLAALLELLRLARRTLLAALLAALLRLSTWLALRSAGLTFLLLALVLVLGVLALRDDEAAVGSARAVKRNAQLRDCNSRHQGAGEQDVAILLQLPDGFEWQVPLLKCDEAHRRCAACRPDCGTSSAPLRPDFGNRLNGFQ